MFSVRSLNQTKKMRFTINSHPAGCASTRLSVRLSIRLYYNTFIFSFFVSYVSFYFLLICAILANPKKKICVSIEATFQKSNKNKSRTFDFIINKEGCTGCLQSNSVPSRPVHFVRINSIWIRFEWRNMRNVFFSIERFSLMIVDTI